MKTSFKFLNILLLFTFFGCSTSGNNKSVSNQDENKIILATNLPQHINGISKLSVSGYGNDLTVINTSRNTYYGYGEIRPLMVLDGMQMGQDLSQIMQLLNPRDELTVEFLSPRLGTIRYGDAAKNGVLVINRISPN